MMELYEEEKNSLFSGDNSVGGQVMGDDPAAGLYNPRDNGDTVDDRRFYLNGGAGGGGLQKSRYFAADTSSDVTSTTETIQEKALLKMSDLIMSFLPTYINSNTYFESGSQRRYKTYIFNLEEADGNDRLSAAKFRLYKRKTSFDDEEFSVVIKLHYITINSSDPSAAARSKF